MNEEIKKLYEEAPRFDCGTLYQSEAYGQTVKERLRVEAMIEKAYGSEVLPMLEEYADTLYQITELECMHFFEQGYLARGDAGIVLL